MQARVGVPLGSFRKRPIRCKNRSAYKDTKTTNETKTMIQTCGKYKINYTKHKGIYFILLPLKLNFFKFNNCCFWVCGILIILLHRASCQVSESYYNCSKYPSFMVRFCVVIFRLRVIIFQFHVVGFRKILCMGS